MPILKAQPDIYPETLLQQAMDRPSPWWALYSLARQEKKLMRQLWDLAIPFYGPTFMRRYRAPNGRLRTSYEPVFPNYVFIQGEEDCRYRAVCTGSVSRWMPVENPNDLLVDLLQLQRLIAVNAPLTPERRLEPGQRVRVRNGVFKGFEGDVLRRENEIRLLIYVRYMGQGASVALDDCQVDLI